MAGDGQILRRAQGPVMVLSLARGPVNALNAALMADLIQALDMAETDPEVSAIVLAAEGAHFCAGLDVAELGRVQNAALPKLTQRIETLTKPLVAALQGNVLGGGLELALACHGRVAHEAARLGLPEISLGLLPVAGSTQRLPRLVGAPVALKLLLEGVPLTAVEALAMGLCDAVVDKNRLWRALTLAERARNRRDMAYSGRLCSQAVGRLFGATGAIGIFRSHIAQQKYRDMAAVMRHVTVNWDIAGTTYGRVAFGLDPGPRFI